jgi:hypothetical protein
MRRSDVEVALVTPPSVLEIVWISLNVNDIWEYHRDVTLGTVRLHNTQDQQPHLSRGAVPLICEFFPGPIGSWKSPLFSLKKYPAKLNMLTERSAVRTDDICERHRISSSFTPFEGRVMVVELCMTKNFARSTSHGSQSTTASRSVFNSCWDSLSILHERIRSLTPSSARKNLPPSPARPQPTPHDLSDGLRTKGPR